MKEKRTFKCPKCNEDNTQFVDILPNEKDSVTCSKCKKPFYIFFDSYGDIEKTE